MFWLHRGFRLYPLYLFIYVVTFAVLSGQGLHTVSSILLNFGAHLFFIQQYVHQQDFVGGSWTLSLEIVWYIILSGLFLLSLNKRTTLIVALAAALSLLADVSCMWGHHIPMGRVSMLDCCVTGLLCYRYDRQDISPRRFFVLLAVMLAVIAANLYIGFQLFPSLHPSASFQTARGSWCLAALVFFVPMMSRHAKLWNFVAFRFMGRISYSVYLVHPVILHLLLRTPITGPLMIFSTFAVTIGLSWLTYKYIESPAIGYGHSIGAPARRPILARSSAE